MKKLLVLVISIIMIIICFNTCYAKEEFILTRKYKLTNTGTRAIKTSFATLKVGQKDFVKYQDDLSVNITPQPDSTFYDELGNLYVTYNFN